MKLAWILLLPLSAVVAVEKPVGCAYVAPVKAEVDGSFFREMISRANGKGETFEGILALFEGRQAGMHQFDFRYPLKDEAHAVAFAKVMRIKAQEAHRFVPVIETSLFVDAAHLGFVRHVAIRNGPVVQEHVLVDSNMPRVIFVEEWEIMGGRIEEGRFAAVNRIVEDGGVWYFAGTYLYDEKPSDDKEVADRGEMFKKTYENMAAFIESGDVDGTYNELKAF